MLLRPSHIFGFPPRLFAYVAGTIAAAAVPLVVAGADLYLRGQRPAEWLGGAVFLALAMAADFRPVPLDEKGSEVSLAFVFIVSARLLFGWEAVPLAALSVLVPELMRRRPPLRALFNSASYTLAAAATFLPELLMGASDGAGTGRLTAFAFADGAVFVVINVALVAGAISLAENLPFRRMLLSDLRKGGAAFGIMGCLAALTADLWLLEPPLLLLLGGPLFTLTLYQRMALRSRLAQRDATTDSLTGLGNHRAYQAALRDRIASDGRDGVFSLCVIDIDDFKNVNDSFGHAVGDELLVQIATLLRAIAGAEAFRFGGDEFAVIVPGGEGTAAEHIMRLQAALSATSDGAAATLSAGIASFPVHGRGADELQRVADASLYWSKRHGKNRACVYSPSLVRIHSTADLEREAERGARLRAATNLVKFIDAKDVSTANHSEIVATLAAAIGRELVLDQETVAQLRLAGLLHDLGKIGVPERILHAPRRLTEDEFAIVQGHSEIGYSLLEGLDLTPVDEWILHHHERWDGGGYPHRLAGDEIPLGARIIHIADAFEAMTANRPYRSARSAHAAVAELRANAGTQFDETVVAAFVRYLTRTGSPEVAAASA
jgi:diguanylate cyclase (GGDEF)-like protein